MSSYQDDLRAHGAGTQEWLAASHHMLIVAYVTPMAQAGSAAVGAADLHMSPIAPATDHQNALPPPRIRQGGAWTGQVWIAPDFDDTDEELLRLFEGEEDDAPPR